MSEDDLNNAVNAVPFLAKSRLVMLSNPSARYSNPQSRRKFFDFILKVPPTATLVISEQVDVKTYRDKSRQEKEDEKHWLVKWIKNTGLGMERFALPAQKEMTGWIINNVNQQGGQIEQAAAVKLAEMVGVDTRQAAQEVAKLLAYVNWARSITLRDVEAASIVSAEPEVFAMVDALASGNRRLAQRQLHSLLENADPLKTWGMILRQFRLLLLAREVIDTRGSQREVERALGLHSYVAEKIFGQAKRFTLPVLEKIYHNLLDIDVGAKTGLFPLDLALEMLVAELSSDREAS